MLDEECVAKYPVVADDYREYSILPDDSSILQEESVVADGEVDSDSMTTIMIGCVVIAALLLTVAIVLVCIIVAKKKNKDVSKVKMEEEDTVKTERPTGIKVKNPNMWDDDFGKKASKLGDLELEDL